MVCGTPRSDIVIEFPDAYSIYSWDEAGGKGHAIGYGITDPLESGPEQTSPEGWSLVLNERKKSYQMVVRCNVPDLGFVTVASEG